MNNFFIKLCFIAPILIGCGIKKADYVRYPTVSDYGEKKQETCSLGLAAFDYFVKPMLEKRCMKGCHSGGGNAENILAFGLGAAIDRQALKALIRSDETEIYLKASGQKPHGGGAAALPEDQKRLEGWVEAERLCDKVI